MADQTPVTPEAQGGGATPQVPAIEHSPSVMIPKARFDEVNTQRQEAEAKLAEALKQIESYKGKDTKIQELEKQISDMKASYELEKSNAKKMSAIDAAIGTASVDPDVVKKLLDMDKISIDEKGISGLDEQIKALKKDKPYLWKKAEEAARQSAQGATKTEKSFARRLAEEQIKRTQVSSKGGKQYF